MPIMTTVDTIKIVKALKPRLGEKAAVELVRYIESAHTENLATKEDLQAVKADVLAVKADVQVLRGEMQALRADLGGQMIALENRMIWKMLGGMGLLLALFTGLFRLFPA